MGELGSHFFRIPFLGANFRCMINLFIWFDNIHSFVVVILLLKNQNILFVKMLPELIVWFLKKIKLRTICGTEGNILLRRLTWCSWIHFKFEILEWLYVCNYPEIVATHSLFPHLYLVSVGIFTRVLDFLMYIWVSKYSLIYFFQQTVIECHWVPNTVLTLKKRSVGGNE